MKHIFVIRCQFKIFGIPNYTMSTTAKKNPFKKLIVFYFLICLLSTIIWANQFSLFTNKKGDDFFYLVVYLLFVTILFYCAQIFSIRNIRSIVLLLIPIITVFTSIIIGLGVLAITSLSGTPTHIIYVYGSLYSVSNILLTIFFTGLLTAKTIK